jgi:hypothetical protein
MPTNFPHPEERLRWQVYAASVNLAAGRVSKDEPYSSWLETREDAPLTVRPVPVSESM